MAPHVGRVWQSWETALDVRPTLSPTTSTLPSLAPLAFFPSKPFPSFPFASGAADIRSSDHQLRSATFDPLVITIRAPCPNPPPSLPSSAHPQFNRLAGIPTSGLSHLTSTEPTERRGLTWRATLLPQSSIPIKRLIPKFGQLLPFPFTPHE